MVIAQVFAMVRDEDDDRVIGQVIRIEVIEDPSDVMVYF